MAEILRMPKFLGGKKRTDPDDICAAFAACCQALNHLSPKSREMVSGWLHERYRAQLEEDMQAAEDALQAVRDAEYVRRVTGREA